MDENSLDVFELAERVTRLEKRINGLESLLKVALEALAGSTLSVKGLAKTQSLRTS